MPETPEKPKVKVACSVPNGLAIRLFKVGYDDGTGDNVRPMIGDGPGIRLNGPSSLHTGAGNTGGIGLEPGITEVDAAWWAAWLAQNQQNPFVGEKMVYEFKDKGEKAPNPL
ncbi:hypothetical protein [Bradyrhizobium sp.]